MCWSCMRFGDLANQEAFGRLGVDKDSGCYCRFSNRMRSPFPGDESEILNDEPGQQMLCFDLMQAIESYCLLPPLR